MSELPSGTVTFLFTDIEGSTRLWEEHPDAMRDALARHDELSARGDRVHGGHVVKTTGDGLFAVFATAPGAIAAAVDAQQQLLEQVWPLPEPLRVRMGLHTGLAVVLGLAPGERIELDEKTFTRLAAAYLDEVEAKFT